ncbi:hypothetical protein DVA67_004480 [Solirubrobacter sp. CPCC 204708]|uniref:Uncharacterized protein n=1 Tax=Solirubrobacter deserti TaxID=2282478 RepID=A0ABT4RHS2_9ACTN|nr:hypothetical protein [Solirubrobacter deserti]MBE2315217.1 hypothetical protein [Solirubrobacter deserti]MDA0137901.1 hypothetical protein [Solirubrobacter deserti]
MTTLLRTGLAALALAVAAVPAAADPADAATKKTKRTAVAKKKKAPAKKKAAKPVAVQTASVPAVEAVQTSEPTPALAPEPTFTSVISIGGFVFYNVTYAEAVAQYQALIASGATPPPPVTSISVTVGVGN